MGSMKISCFTCRKSRTSTTLDGTFVCKHRRERFAFFHDEPCENWMPSKCCIRKRLKERRVTVNNTVRGKINKG